MSTTNDADDGQTADRLTDALRDHLGPDESVTEMTVEEFGEALREAGFATKESLTATITSGGSPLPGSDDALELFGTGVAGDDGDATAPPAETRAALEGNMNRSWDPEDYETGVQATGSGQSDDSHTDTPLNELTGSADGVHPVVDVEDHPIEAFNTGVAGDASGAEHRQREKQAEIWARAIEKAEERRTEE